MHVTNSLVEHWIEILMLSNCKYNYNAINHSIPNGSISLAIKIL